MTTFEQIIQALIDTRREAQYWDFKREPHTNKADLLHDILCMANALHNGERYIILGVENDGNIVGLTTGQASRKTQVQYIDYLRTKDFAGGIRPEVEMRTITLAGKELDVIVVLDKPHKPYYLTKEEKVQGSEVKPYHIYTRIGDQNTPKDTSADLIHIEKMWRERFGLDKSAMDRLLYLLKEPQDWEKRTGNADCIYHKYFPEFQLVFSEGLVPSTIEQNMKGFLKVDRTASIEIKYHNTTLHKTQMELVILKPPQGYKYERGFFIPNYTIPLWLPPYRSYAFDSGFSYGVYLQDDMWSYIFNIINHYTGYADERRQEAIDNLSCFLFLENEAEATKFLNYFCRKGYIGTTNQAQNWQLIKTTYQEWLKAGKP